MIQAIRRFTAAMTCRRRIPKDPSLFDRNILIIFEPEA